VECDKFESVLQTEEYAHNIINRPIIE
jgi:hypothetical protein